MHKPTISLFFFSILPASTCGSVLRKFKSAPKLVLAVFVCMVLSPTQQEKARVSTFSSLRSFCSRDLKNVGSMQPQEMHFFSHFHVL